MARKVYCTNTECKHYKNGDACDTTVKIGYGGKCESFEKGFVYYFHLVWEALGNANFINPRDLTDDLRIGLYYVMEVYHLGFSEMEWGTWRMLMLKDKKDGKGLRYEEIVAREIDHEVFDRLFAEFNEGKLPNLNKEKAKKESQPFGWLSPSGVFTDGDFGEHEEVAELIVEKKGFDKEYFEWRKTKDDSKLYRDFLSEVKGYCLIHNPSMDGGYIVSNIKPLTKNQKDFLYGYFIDMGDRFKAEQYVS